MEDPDAIGNADDSMRIAMSVGAAKASGDPQVLIVGYVVISAGVATICDTLAESYPPHCAGDSMRVLNPDDLDLGRTESSGDTTWTPAPVRLIGRAVRDGFFVAATIADAE